MGKASLGVVDLARRGGVDAPIEAQFAGGIVRLKANRLLYRCEDGGFGRGGAGEEDQERDFVLGGTENGPVLGARVFEAGVNDVFGALGLIGLGDDAAAGGEGFDDGGGELGEGVDGQVADAVRDFAAVDGDVAGVNKGIRLGAGVKGC